MNFPHSEHSPRQKRRWQYIRERVITGKQLVTLLSALVILITVITGSFALGFYYSRSEEEVWLSQIQMAQQETQSAQVQNDVLMGMVDLLKNNVSSLEAILLQQWSHKAEVMRITGYVPSSPKTAIGKKPRPGRTAAISRNCLSFLGYRVYVEGMGTYYVEDITANWVDDKYDMCTLDIAVNNESQAKHLTDNKGKRVAKIAQMTE